MFLQFFIVVLLADFVTGLVHWAEDNYCSETTPIIGPLLIRPNELHHRSPRHFVRLSWWQSARVSIGAALIFLGIWFAIGLSFTWQLWLFVLLTVNANEVHKMAHRSRSENGPLISMLHDLCVLQTPGHHAGHHLGDGFELRYCVLTNLLNPCLDRTGFWTFLENRVLGRCCGVMSRRRNSQTP